MKVLAMKCVNCGAGIEIGPETDTFACSYCGTQQLVKRSGGIVVLQRIGAALDEVKRGTNRAASELAIQRLLAEVSAIEVQRDSAVSDLRVMDESNSAIIGWALLLGVPGAIFLFGWWSIPVVVTGFVFGWRFITPASDKIMAVEADAEARIAPLKELIARHQAIIDAYDFNT